VVHLSIMRKFALLQLVVESCPLALWSIPPHHHTQSHIYIFHLPKQSHVKSIWKMITRYPTFGPGTVACQLGLLLFPSPIVIACTQYTNTTTSQGEKEPQRLEHATDCLCCQLSHVTNITLLLSSVRFLTNRKVVDLLILLTS
jgi:hypothetical protein